MSIPKYIPFDEKSLADHKAFREAFAVLEMLVVDTLNPSRPRSIVTTKLDEAFMWVGKSLLLDQLSRTPPEEETAE